MSEKKKSMPMIDVRKCNSCIVCIDSCPVECLALSPRPVKQHCIPYMPEPLACIGCGRCAEDCPVEAIEMIVCTS